MYTLTKKDFYYFIIINEVQSTYFDKISIMKTQKARSFFMMWILVPTHMFKFYCCFNLKLRAPMFEGVLVDTIMTTYIN